MKVERVKNRAAAFGGATSSPPTGPESAVAWCNGSGWSVRCTAGHVGGRGYASNPMRCRGDDGTLYKARCTGCPECKPGSPDPTEATGAPPIEGPTLDEAVDSLLRLGEKIDRVLAMPPATPKGKE